MVNEVEQKFPTNFIIYTNIMSVMMLQITILSDSFCKEEYKVTYDVHNYVMRNILSQLLL